VRSHGADHDHGDHHRANARESRNEHEHAAGDLDDADGDAKPIRIVPDTKCSRPSAIGEKLRPTLPNKDVCQKRGDEPQQNLASDC
jgi:hypothetical protein